jgi:hypothetical protein
MLPPLRGGGNIFFSQPKAAYYNIQEAGVMKKDIDYWVKKVQHLLGEAEGLRAEGAIELGDILQESAYDDVPAELIAEVKKKCRIK